MVLGGGFGGAQAALTTDGLLGDGHRITVVDRSEASYLCGANPLLMVGERPRAGVTRPLATLAEHGIDLVLDEILTIDPDGRRVQTTRQVLPFDYLVVALGAVYDWNAVPGSGAAGSFYDHAHSVALREAVGRFEGGKVVVAVSGAPYKCPPAPLEAALVLEWHFRKRGVPAQIHLCIPEPAPLAVAGPETAKRVADVLTSRGVVLHTQATATSLEDSGRRVYLSDGSTLDADLSMVVPVHRAPAVAVEAGLTMGMPWVPVDPETLETRAAPGVFAVGDVNSIPIGGERALPKAGVFASAQGRLAAEVIASRVLGTSPPAPYDGAGSCFLHLSGEEVAEVGGVFLAPGGPQVGLGDPRPASFKERWEAEWQRFEI